MGNDGCLAWAVGSIAKLQLILSQDHGDHQHHFPHPTFGLLAAAKALLNFLHRAWCLEMGTNGESQHSPEGAEMVP